MTQLSPRTNHIGVLYHWFRMKIVNLDIMKIVNLDIHVEPSDTKDQLTNQLTKGLCTFSFQAAWLLLMGWRVTPTLFG
jgi:hypothetical protein